MTESILISLECPNCGGEFSNDDLNDLKQKQHVTCGFCGKKLFLNNKELLEILPEKEEEPFIYTSSINMEDRDEDEHEGVPPVGKTATSRMECALTSCRPKQYYVHFLVVGGGILVFILLLAVTGYGMRTQEILDVLLMFNDTGILYITMIAGVILVVLGSMRRLFHDDQSRCDI